MRYITKPNAIILAVTAANTDLACVTTAPWLR